MGDSRMKINYSFIFVLVALIPQSFFADVSFPKSVNSIPFGENNSNKYHVDISVVEKTGHRDIQISASAGFSIYRNDENVVCKIHHLTLLSKIGENIQANIRIRDLTLNSALDVRAGVKFSSEQKDENMEIITETFGIIINDIFLINLPNELEIKDNQNWVNERNAFKLDSSIPYYNNINIKLINERESLYAISFSGLSSSNDSSNIISYALKHTLLDKKAEKVISVNKVFVFTMGNNYRRLFLIKLHSLD